MREKERKRLKKREKREKKREKERRSERKERNREKKREKREKRREKERNRCPGQLLSICIQITKRKTKYIGRNARNFKKWLLLRGPIYYNGPPSL